MIGVNPKPRTLAELHWMAEGHLEHVGDLYGLLYAHIRSAGMNAPRNGIPVERVHPYPSIVIKRRRAATAKHPYPISMLKCFLRQER